MAVSKEQTDRGLWSSTSRLLEKGAQWTVDSEETKIAFNRAMLVAGEHLFIVPPKGNLNIHHVSDGRRLGTVRTELPAYEGLAAARGRLYVATATGRVICLAADGTQMVP